MPGAAMPRTGWEEYLARKKKYSARKRRLVRYRFACPSRESQQARISSELKASPPEWICPKSLAKMGIKKLPKKGTKMPLELNSDDERLFTMDYVFGLLD